jgi:hypothetical protein
MAPTHTRRREQREGQRPRVPTWTLLSPQRKRHALSYTVTFARKPAAMGVSRPNSY